MWPDWEREEKKTGWNRAYHFSVEPKLIINYTTVVIPHTIHRTPYTVQLDDAPDSGQRGQVNT